MTLLADFSDVGIANLALSAAEAPSTLVGLEQPNSKAARVCRLQLPMARDSIIRNYGFAFSNTEEACAEVLPAPIGGDFANAFNYPTEALRIIRVKGMTKQQWRTDGRRQILATATGPIIVMYKKRVTDFSLWDQLALDLLVADLALRIAPELTHVQGITARLKESYADLAHRAPRIDAFEQESEGDDYDDAQYVPGYIAARA